MPMELFAFVVWTSKGQRVGCLERKFFENTHRPGSPLNLSKECDRVSVLMRVTMGSALFNAFLIENFLHAAER